MLRLTLPAADRDARCNMCCISDICSRPYCLISFLMCFMNECKQKVFEVSG